MPTEHSVAADPEIHEPKGASTAVAGTVYVSDGAGSGSWTQVEPAGVDLASTGEILTENGSGGSIWVEPGLSGSLKLIEGSEAVSTIGTTPQELTFYDQNFQNGITASTSTGRITLSELIFGSGIYVITFDATIATAAAGDAGTYTFRLRRNAVESASESAGCSVYMSGTDDLTNIHFSTIGSFSSNDFFSVYVESDEAGDTDDLVFTYANFNMFRIQVA